jgi:dimeric dUTPase (all-alpha-NTP-PPase superfamily)
MLQDQINTRIKPDWRAAQHPWYRAIWTECAELLDHHGWKWWKKQTPNMPQIWLELVDIWHFALSDLLQRHDSEAACITSIVDALTQPRTARSVDQTVELLAQGCLTSHSIDLVTFFDLTDSVQLEFQQLFEQYVGKNVLNRFRQDHGYQEGSYQKVWHGQEDNEHLAELFLKLDFTQEDIAQALYDALLSRYTAKSELE